MVALNLDGPGHAPPYLCVRPMNPAHRFEFCAGVLGCLVWPMLFGYIVVNNSGGKWGIHLGLVSMAIVMAPIVLMTKKPIQYIARGSWIMALLSVFPLIPVRLGGYHIDMVRHNLAISSYVDEGPP